MTNFVRIFEPDAALRREYAAGMLGSRSLAETFDPAANGITLLRLSLALVVVFSHAFKIGAFGADPGEVLSGGQTQLGTVAVAAFMVLSGFLVTRSRETAGARRFAWRRLLRVMPAYWVCLAVTAFVVAPAAALAVGGGVEPGEALGYVTGNALLVHLVPGVGSAFASDPYAYIANGSLWTLAPEAACYIVILCIPRRYLRTVAPALLAGLAVVHLARMTGADPSIIAVDFPLEFALGACAWLFRDRIPMLR